VTSHFFELGSAAEAQRSDATLEDDFYELFDLYQCVLEILTVRRSRNISAGLRQSNMAAAQGPT